MSRVPPPGPAGDVDDQLPLDQCMTLLAAPLRRRIIETLDRHPDGQTTDQLLAILADGDQAASERMALALHHIHLPKLRAADVIETSSGVHRPGPEFERYARFRIVLHSEPMSNWQRPARQ